MRGVRAADGAGVLVLRNDLDEQPPTSEHEIEHTTAVSPAERLVEGFARIPAQAPVEDALLGHHQRLPRRHGVKSACAQERAQPRERNALAVDFIHDIAGVGLWNEGNRGRTSRTRGRRRGDRRRPIVRLVEVEEVPEPGVFDPGVAQVAPLRLPRFLERDGEIVERPTRVNVLLGRARER